MSVLRRSRHVAIRCLASCPVSDFIGHCVTSRTGRARCESTTRLEGPVTGNIPEVLDNGEVTDGTHVTAGQLALALRSSD